MKIEIFLRNYLKILNVAEKNSSAKSLASVLSDNNKFKSVFISKTKLNFDSLFIYKFLNLRSQVYHFLINSMILSVIFLTKNVK